MKKVAVLQSNYIPWKGYFDIIHDVDLFVFYDEVQYTVQDWRNRNKIKSKEGSFWLIVPVNSNLNNKIYEVKIAENHKNWCRKHFNAIQLNYAKAPFYKKYKDFLEYVYLEKEWQYLFELNRFLIEHISKEFLKINTAFADSREFKSSGQKHDKLLEIVKATDATTYISGPSAKDYMIIEDYKAAGIEVLWKDYTDYPEYPQIHNPFEHHVSILDLLFNVGDDASYYIWGHRENG